MNTLSGIVAFALVGSVAGLSLAMRDEVIHQWVPAVVWQLIDYEYMLCAICVLAVSVKRGVQLSTLGEALAVMAFAWWAPMVLGILQPPGVTPNVLKYAVVALMAVSPVAAIVQVLLATRQGAKVGVGREKQARQ